MIFKTLLLICVTHLVKSTSEGPDPKVLSQSQQDLAPGVAVSEDQDAKPPGAQGYSSSLDEYDLPPGAPGTIGHTHSEGREDLPPGGKGVSVGPVDDLPPAIKKRSAPEGPTDDLPPGTPGTEGHTHSEGREALLPGGRGLSGGRVDNLPPAIKKRTVPEAPCGPVCMMACEYGRVYDSNGCPTCQCNPSPPAQCGGVCYMLCQYGNVEDSNGCPLCECKPPPPGTLSGLLPSLIKRTAPQGPSQDLPPGSPLTASKKGSQRLGLRCPFAANKDGKWTDFCYDVISSRCDCIMDDMRMIPEQCVDAFGFGVYQRMIEQQLTYEKEREIRRIRDGRASDLKPYLQMLDCLDQARTM